VTPGGGARASVVSCGRRELSERAARGWDPISTSDVVNSVKIVAILLVIPGPLGLVYSRFNYARETHEAKLGPFELLASATQTANIPV
jgi:hypothetical protein